VGSKLREPAEQRLIWPGGVEPWYDFDPVSPPASSPSLPPAAPDAEPASVDVPAILAEDQKVPLRLTASRGALGLELYEQVEIGPVSVTRLALTLPGLRFPLDLSGGVPKFRHRRGELELIALALDLSTVEGWATRRSTAVFGDLQRPLCLWPLESGLGVGLVAAGKALSFDLLWAPDQGDARFVIANARGVGLEAPALAVALRIVGSVFGRTGERRGRVVRIVAVGQHIGRLLLPAVGARAPSGVGVGFGPCKVRDRRIEVLLEASRVGAELPIEVTRALELSELVRDADERLAEGDVDAARTGYVTALERAPRHPEIVRLIAEIDVRVRGRVEAALGLLVESLPATQAGLVGAELLASVGDITGARQAVGQAVLHEAFAPLAALEWLRLAELDPDAPLRMQALDRSVACAPGLPEPRWARFRVRVERGDLERALSDAEHLEAVESGARAKHDVCRKAARALLDAGHIRDAGRLFERALRYLPDDATATAGLARALVLAGGAKRALVLFERAVELGERIGHLDAEALIDLARVLAEHAKDLPQAIARLRQVSAASERVVEARYLEAVYRARLGDRVGAALGFGRMREAIELSAQPSPAFAVWLGEAAENALGVDDDALGAERHLAVALRLAPEDTKLAARYREVAALAANVVRSRR
jgi:tetratricopeptide (TPR) repeat protein